MFLNKITNRRNIIKAGIASLTSTFVASSQSQSAIKPKAKGETKVVYLGGDQLHNGLGQELELRGVFKKSGWRLLFVTDARYVTPELISDADLLIITRWGGGIAGWSPEPVVEVRPESDGYMSDELESAIIDNVKNRGMG